MSGKLFFMFGLRQQDCQIDHVWNLLSNFEEMCFQFLDFPVSF